MLRPPTWRFHLGALPMSQRMDDSPQSPHIPLFRYLVASDDLRRQPLGGTAVTGSFAQGGESEIPKDDLWDMVVRGNRTAEEDVGGLNVAVDDTSPATWWSGVVVVDAVMEELEGFGQLDEDVPDESFGSVIAGGQVPGQVSTFAVLEV